MAGGAVGTLRPGGAPVAPGATGTPRVTEASGAAETARTSGAFLAAGRTAGTPAGTVGTTVPA
jgi:hypothetical protein